MNSKSCSIVLALLLVMFAAGSICADPTSWAAFDPALVEDISIAPAFATDTLNYLLTVGANPKIILDSGTYDVNWIQAFFVVSQDTSTNFTATAGSTNSGWSWFENMMPGQIAGWKGEGFNRLYPGEWYMFSFADFNIDGNEVLPGYHIGWGLNGEDFDTGYYKVVPEPSSMMGLSAMLVASASLWRRMRRH